MRFKITFIFCLFGLIVFSQDAELDSLLALYKNVKHDTVKCELLYQLGDLVPEEELEKYSDELELCAKRLLNTKLDEKKAIKYRGYIATAYNNKALALQHNGDDYNALIYYKKSLEFSDSDEWLAQKASTLLNIGTVYFSRADYPKTIDYYLKSIKISEKIRDTVELANAWNNLALVYAQQNDRKKAIEIYTKALNLREAIHDMKGVANSYYNIATSHLAMKDFESSMEYFKKCYEIRLQLGNGHYIANTLNGIGKLWNTIGQPDSAIKYLNQSIEISKEIKNKEPKVNAMLNLVMAYAKKKDYKKAILIGEECLALAKELENPRLIESGSNQLYKLYQLTGNSEKAFNAYVLYISMRDSLMSTENQKAAIEAEIKYNFDKKVLEDSLSHVANIEKENMRHQQEIKTQRTYTYGGFIGLALMLVVAGVSFKAYKDKQKANVLITEQKQIVETQKHLVEEKQKEILDSIAYAKRLQEAILPPQNIVTKYLPDNFILYLPKDIVAGDFYWFEHLDNGSYIAAADSTGHGVPGAMVSVVCSNALNRAVHEFGLRVPGEILDKTRELVLETFAKSDKDVKDGMDISLVKITELPAEKDIPGRLVIPKGQTLKDVMSSQTKYKIEWAGANNPLWYYSEGQIHEIKAHKQPIGKTEQPTSFPTHSFELIKGDELFLFTDGFADQFGGTKGKKFKYKQLEEVLLQSSTLPLLEQKQHLASVFNNWKANLEQVDDVTIIGIRI
ncbi:MAG: tetratricopeptide repeat protein [Bacteroidetes bacterium]|nr:tetratricopeptide repeat protein [Bacteroidota bacterium]